jgi:hypothetical protein
VFFRRSSALAACVALLAACNKNESSSGSTAASKPHIAPDDSAQVIDPSLPNFLSSAQAPPDEAPGITASAAPPASAAPSDSSSPPAAASATAAHWGDLKLLDPGQPPRQKLRYRFQAGHPDTFAMDVKVAASVEVGQNRQPEVPLPVVRVVVGVDPKSVSPEGDLHYDYRIVGVDVIADQGVPPDVAAGFKKNLGMMPSLSGSAVVTDRGLTKDITFNAPESGSPQVVQLLEQLRETVRELAPPFPEEEVGKGAKWERTSKVMTNAGKVSQVQDFTLSALNGDAGELDIALKQSAPPQVLHGADSPLGQDVKLEKVDTTGRGTSTFDLGHLVPKSEVNATTLMIFSGNGEDGQAQRMKMTLKLGVKIGAAPGGGAHHDPPQP